MATTRRYNAKFNQSAIADILTATMKLIGALDAIDEWHVDGDRLEVETINHLEERLEALCEEIIKIWSYPLDNERQIGGDLEGEAKRPDSH